MPRRREAGRRFFRAQPHTRGGLYVLRIATKPFEAALASDDRPRFPSGVPQPVHADIIGGNGVKERLLG
jgi:hypothetical protein